MRANKRSERPNGLLKTRLSVTRNATIVGWLVSWVVGQLAEGLVSPIREEMFRFGWVVGQLAVNQTSQGRNIQVWLGDWSVG